MAQTSLKAVICGAGFLGSNVAQTLSRCSAMKYRVQISSRNPTGLHDSLKRILPVDSLLPPMALDITQPSTLQTAFRDADVVISLVGIMYGKPKDFDNIQWKGAENVARAAKDAGAKLVHISAIGADSNSDIPYNRTKGLGERAVFDTCPDATIIRPSIIFGREDSFFNRFSRLSQLLPFLPVFGGGVSLLQPVYVGDLARAVEIIARNDPVVSKSVAGKIIEAGGPEVFTYKDLMKLVLEYTRRRRLIVSIPFPVGIMQGKVLEKLPLNLFTVTSAQVKQLRSDNVVSLSPPENHVSFQELVETHYGPLRSVHEILPTYL